MGNFENFIFANFVQLLFCEIRGRLRKALAGLGEGEFVVEDHQEDQSPLLKETECPVCLQVDHDGAGPALLVGAGHGNGNGV